MIVGSLVALGVLAWGATVPPTGAVPIRIDMDAPAGCSDSAMLYDAIRARTSRPRLAEEGEQAILVRVRLTRVGNRVRGELRVIDEQGETDTRRVEGDTCDEVVQALSLTAALAIDPTAYLSVPPPPPPPAPIASVPPPPPPEPPPPPPPPSRASGFELGAEAVAAEIVSPRVSFGGALEARWSWTTGAVLNPSLGVALLYLRNDAFEPATSAEVQWAAAALTACPLRWRVSHALHVEPCLLAVGGAILATGRSVAHPSRVVRPWWSIGSLLRAEVLIAGGVGLELEGGMSAPLVKRRFVTTTAEHVVGETPPVSALIGLGLFYRF